jgi:hypothetical protein
MHGLQEQELQQDEEPQDAHGAHAAEEVLPDVPEAHGSQRDEVTKVLGL